MADNDTTVHIRFTDAPEAYDYGNTSTLSVVGVTKRGREIRKIQIVSDHSLRFQEPRYYSGLHFCITHEDMAENHDLYGDVDADLL